MVNDVISSGSIEISEKESINYLEVVRQIKKWYPYMIEEIEYMEFEWVNDSTIEVIDPRNNEPIIWLRIEED